MKLTPLHKLFDIKYGVNLELINLEQCEKNNPNSANFVSRTEKNNGISAFVLKVNDIEPNPAHTISVAGGGSVLSSFYQKDSYYSGRDIYILIAKNKMREIEMLFYAFCLTKNKYRYNYGRQANKTLKDILVPEQMPDEFASINYEALNTLKFESIINKNYDLNTNNWKIFDLINVFKITLGKPIHSTELEENMPLKNDTHIPYVTRTTLNNGVEFFVPQSIETDKKINNGNCITVGAEGFRAFYQKINFINGNKINVLRHEKLNKYNALFLCTLLNLEIQNKFNYGRGVTKERLCQLSIKLPTENGQPNFEFMENYIKSLSYSKNI